MSIYDEKDYEIARLNEALCVQSHETLKAETQAKILAWYLKYDGNKKKTITQIKYFWKLNNKEAEALFSTIKQSI